MRKRNLLLLFTVFAFCSFALTGDYTEIVSPISSTEMPSTSKPNKEVKFKIISTLNSDCEVYSRQETNQKGKIVTVTVYGEYPTNQNCNKITKEIKTDYSFTPKSKGKYIFQFTTAILGGTRFFKTDTLVVK